jgi:hypothetical protein
MTAPLYDASVPLMVRALKATSGFLTKAEAWATERKIAPEALIEARLAPDMHPLRRQIHMASDAAKGPAARLSQSENPSMPDVEATFEELQSRIAKTVDFLTSRDPATFEGAETRPVTLKFPHRTVEFASGAEYLYGFALPNFYFHVSAAYLILRHNGLAIGKMDFLGPNEA